jgi:hypothetical protein
VGATTTVTWNISVGALPAGLVLNTSTGAITGTAVGVGTIFTAHWTDGTHSASKSLSIHVGTGFNSITVVHTTVSTGPNGAIVLSSNVTAGNCLLFTMYGYGRHQGALGYAPLISGLTDTVGTVFNLVSKYQGGVQAGVVQWMGSAASSGADTIQFNGPFSPYGLGSPLNINVVEFSGTQCNLTDSGTTLSDFGGSTSIISLTTTFPNELLYGVIATQDPDSNPATGLTFTPSTGFSQATYSHSWGSMETDSKNAATIGSYTLSESISASSFWSLGMIGLFPSVVGTPTFVKRHKGWVF